MSNGWIEQHIDRTFEVVKMGRSFHLAKFVIQIAINDEGKILSRECWPVLGNECRIGVLA